eukprot:GFUD01004624.1.p1 GENE.GFUD01004624.1~~GFUD01004624.1.p1  ORF type:complete len:324 (+),score=77.62 GFUD01004624.1:85-972(+)
MAFKELKEDKDFFDVTLACNGDRQLQAHKVILSACSPFFRNILKKNPHQHPLIYLKGVLYEELVSVLNFMYHGEVNVAQEDLTSFLAVAEELKVKGLTQDKQEKSKTYTKHQTTENKSPGKVPGKVDHMPSPSLPKKQTNQPIPSASYEEKIRNETNDIVPQIKTEAPIVIDCDPDQDIPANSMMVSNDYEELTSGYDYDQSYDDQVQFPGEVGHGQSMDLTQDDGGLHKFSWKTGWTEKKNVTCDICFKTFSSKKSLTNHLGIHKGLTTCAICQKVFATTSSLNLHIKNSHTSC